MDGMEHNQTFNFVHRTSIFLHRLTEIRKTRAVGELAARKAEKIVDKLINGLRRGNAFDNFGQLTKHGELRVKNCRKYDLGGGYRLVTVRRNNLLHITYIGTHDECHRWLERHRGLAEISTTSGDIIPVRRINNQQHPFRSGQGAEAADEPEAMRLTIKDRDLRRIFSGLVEGCAG
jgi:hypothetical protein